MILCLDVGNSHIYGGVFDGQEIKLRFRSTSSSSTSDELGVFLRAVLQQNHIASDDISEIVLCSVVPHLDYSLQAACKKYFSLEPFILQPGVKTGLKIKYQNPLEVGSDRIATAIAAVTQFPNKHLIIIDFGTATTFCAITANKEYLGGVILPGVKLSMQTLEAKTAKLPEVAIIKPEQCLGRTTVKSIQSGLFFGAVGACKQIISQLKQEAFANDDVMVIATGGFAHLFEDQSIYDLISQDLVLQGLRQALLLNKV